MTRVRITLKRASAEGLQPVTDGVVSFAPRRHVTADKSVVVRELFTARLGTDGGLTVDLTPTDGTFVWHVVELPGTSNAFDRYVEVPKPAEGDNPPAVEYADLVDVNPNRLVPEAMSGGGILKTLTASSEEDAQALSEQHPDYLVFYPENASASKAREIIASLDGLQAEAQTSAATVASLKAQAVTDAGVISDLHAAALDTGDMVSAKQLEVLNSADTAVRSIDEAVKQVTDRASQAQNDIQSAEDDAKNDTASRPGDGEGTQTGTTETAKPDTTETVKPDTGSKGETAPTATTDPKE